MKYNGIELTEFTSDKPVIFDPPKRMVVWDTDNNYTVDMVIAYLPGRVTGKISGVTYLWQHCAEIPEDHPKPRRATNCELAKWLAKGNGEWTTGNMASTLLTYTRGFEHDEVLTAAKVRKWDDTEWHEPTVDYMFGEAEE